jgi:uncharacterized membrane protein YphA (DoxX/SURF4 family)
MNVFIQIIRLITGLTFIFSGFVKMIDPVGTKIKMLEYFSEEVLNLSFLNPFALEISVFLILLEFVLGIWLLIGYKSKFTIKALMLLIIVFLFLTGYSAYFNKVTDCGCFGDAIKLSPWETFYKNVVLLILIIFLFFNKEKIRPLFRKRITLTLAIFFVFFSVLLMVYTIRHLPLIDFRPYAIGKNITEGMKIPEGAPQAKFKDIWYYKVNGKVKEYNNSDEPWNIPGAEFVDRKTIILSEGYVPPIHDFSIENESGDDFTEQVLNEPEIFLVISAEPNEISSRAKNIVNDFADKIKNKNKKIIGLFSITDARIQSTFHFHVYLTDATTLKTMIRSNPGVIKLENGTVVQKIAWRDL